MGPVTKVVSVLGNVFPGACVDILKDVLNFHLNVHTLTKPAWYGITLLEYPLGFWTPLAL